MKQGRQEFQIILELKLYNYRPIIFRYFHIIWRGAGRGIVDIIHISHFNKMFGVHIKEYLVMPCTSRKCYAYYENTVLIILIFTSHFKRCFRDNALTKIYV